jgi:hypothetical protein
MSREAWQAAITERRLSNGEGQFLPPQYMTPGVIAGMAQDLSPQDLNANVVHSRTKVDAAYSRVQEAVPKMHSLLLNGVRQAVEQGYVPEAALDRLGPTFTQTAVQVVDKTMLAEMGAYYHRTDTMYVSSDAQAHALDWVVAHELGGHKLSGGTFVTSEDGRVARTRRGFVTDAGSRHFGLDEAVQHHLILSYVNGEIDVVDPDERQDVNYVYEPERKLLAEFISRSKGIIDLKAITRGSFEDSDESGAATLDRRIMVQQATAAYGPGAYRKLDLLFDLADIGNKSALEVAERIEPPVVGTDGRVLQRGNIDIDEDILYDLLQNEPVE